MEATGVEYTGVDVVAELVEDCSRRWRRAGMKFICADITMDPLPGADLYLVRQVLQHLSNREISAALENLGRSKWALISEDLPIHPRWTNLDKHHGPDVRSYSGSGVYVDRPPFSMPVTELSSTPLTATTLLRTVIVRPT